MQKITMGINVKFRGLVVRFLVSIKSQYLLQEYAGCEVTVRIDGGLWMRCKLRQKSPIQQRH